MDKEELKEIFFKAIYEVDKIRPSFNDSEKKIIKGILYSLYYGCD